MEKKNINTGVVRICTILLLTVFAIGRKYGQEQKAADLINNLKQQPCTCCLNFENVAKVAQGIDETKRLLEEEKVNLVNNKNILEGENNQLRQDKEELREQKGYLEGQLQETKKQVEAQEGKLKEEIQKIKM